MVLPVDIAVGDKLNDYSITINFGGMKTITSCSDIKVTSEEKLNIGETNIDCLIVEGKYSFKSAWF